MILCFPNSGETHRSHGPEFPFVVLSGSNCKLNLGNFYTTILNSHGNPIKHFGDIDTTLKMDQLGPIKRFMV